MKVLKIIGFVIIGIIIIGGGILVLYKSTYPPKKIFVTDISVTDSNITLKATFIDSALAYKGYNVEYRNEALFFKIKAGLISFKKSKDINISVSNSFGKIKEVYLEDNNPANNVLIWPKK